MVRIGSLSIPPSSSSSSPPPFTFLLLFPPTTTTNEYWAKKGGLWTHFVLQPALSTSLRLCRKPLRSREKLAPAHALENRTSTDEKLRPVPPSRCREAEELQRPIPGSILAEGGSKYGIQKTSPSYTSTFMADGPFGNTTCNVPEPPITTPYSVAVGLTWVQALTPAKNRTTTWFKWSGP